MVNHERIQGGWEYDEDGFPLQLEKVEDRLEVTKFLIGYRVYRQRKRLMEKESQRKDFTASLYNCVGCTWDIAKSLGFEDINDAFKLLYEEGGLEDFLLECSYFREVNSELGALEMTTEENRVRRVTEFFKSVEVLLEEKDLVQIPKFVVNEFIVRAISPPAFRNLIRETIEDEEFSGE